MDIKLVKMTRSFMTPHLIFCDFLILDIILFKGLIFDEKKESLYLPVMVTQGGAKFTPIVFPVAKMHVDFIKMALQLIKEAPKPTETEPLTDEQKAEILKQRAAKRRGKNDFRPRPKGCGTGSQKDKGSPKVLQVDKRKEIASRIWTRPNPQGDAKKPISNLCGKGFVNLPPRPSKR